MSFKIVVCSECGKRSDQGNEMFFFEGQLSLCEECHGYWIARLLHNERD